MFYSPVCGGCLPLGAGDVGVRATTLWAGSVPGGRRAALSPQKGNRAALIARQGKVPEFGAFLGYCYGIWDSLGVGSWVYELPDSFRSLQAERGLIWYQEKKVSQRRWFCSVFPWAGSSPNIPGVGALPCAALRPHRGSSCTFVMLLQTAPCL